jgi:hypothetical protein
MARNSMRRAAPMTAAERQKLERERNNRARQVVIVLGDFATNAIDWENQRQLTKQEILAGLYMLAKWGRDGQVFIDETRLTLPPDRRAFTAKVFDRFNIDMPFCRECGADLKEHAEGEWEWCKCKRAKLMQSN